MKLNKAIFPVLAIAMLGACDDNVSTIGESISDDNVKINVDSLTLALNSHVIEAMNVDARATHVQIGSINVPEFGRLDASFVTQLLCASALTIPDTIPTDAVDEMRIILSVPRQYIIGDSVAPQQLTVHTLNDQLPRNITSNYDISGKYNPTAVIKQNYTLSGLALSDSAFNNLSYLPISLKAPGSWALESVKAYRDPQVNQVFQWPATFNAKAPGLFFKPSFGEGAIANITSIKLFAYWHHYITRVEVENGEAVNKKVLMRDSVCLYSSAPEVISSTLYNYTPSQSLLNLIAEGKQIITTPLGYRVRFSFPVSDILQQYWASDHNLAIINNLTLAIPAKAVPNEFGLGTAPDLLMIRTSEVEEFFSNGKVPDNKTSFRGIYNNATGRYEFASLREYIIAMKALGNKATPDDSDFTLIPVAITTENGSTGYYGQAASVYVTGCDVYLDKPTATLLDTEHANIVFTFTQQLTK